MHTCDPGTESSVSLLGQLVVHETIWDVRTSFDTFPDVNAAALWVPYTTLRVYIPGNIQFPDSCRITDDCGHLKRMSGRVGSERWTRG